VAAETRRPAHRGPHGLVVRAVIPTFERWGIVRRAVFAARLYIPLDGVTVMTNDPKPESVAGARVYSMKVRRFPGWGPGEVRNRGFEMAKREVGGPFLLYLADDDVLVLPAMQNEWPRIAALALRPSTGFVLLAPDARSPASRDPAGPAYRYLPFGGPCGGLVMRSEVFEEVDGWGTRLLGDIDFTLRVSKAGYSGWQYMRPVARNTHIAAGGLSGELGKGSDRAALWPDLAEQHADVLERYAPPSSVTGVRVKATVMRAWERRAAEHEQAGEADTRR